MQILEYIEYSVLARFSTRMYDCNEILRAVGISLWFLASKQNSLYSLHRLVRITKDIPGATVLQAEAPC